MDSATNSDNMEECVFAESTPILNMGNFCLGFFFLSKSISLKCRVLAEDEMSSVDNCLIGLAYVYVDIITI